MDLSVGEMVVVPALGVGVVDANEEVDVGEDEHVRAYRIDLGATEGAYWIPEERVGTQGLRKPVPEEAVSRIWKEMLSQEAPAKRANWNRRRKRYDEMLLSNEPLQLAALVGELVAVRNAKKEKKQTLSFGERRLLEKAERLLIEEIAATSGKTTDKVAAEMTKRQARL